MPATELGITPHMTYGQMRGYAASLGVDVCSDNLPDDKQGMYVRTLNLIMIERDTTYRVKRCALVHELVHWEYRDASCGGGAGMKSERRTRLLAASLLVSPAEYASAEEIYEGERLCMASELDVTVQVLDDYRELVLPRFVVV
jgi:Zn-dependent peptidase ImmA (M78 family)